MARQGRECFGAGVQPRTYANPAGYGRLVFDWDGAVVCSARIEGKALVATFDRPIRGNVRNTLPGYVTRVALSPDRRTATFTLAPGKIFSVKIGFYNNVVAIDLIEEKNKANKKDEDKEKERERNGTGRKTDRRETLRQSLGRWAGAGRSCVPAAPCPGCDNTACRRCDPGCRAGGFPWPG
ncbi:MAG: hypothetical protein FD153_1268 [Rhodospirillaceae bacterium]|nr:MAG: hypothetical protein FD153_1268 [Rhodospirillaceae bacterium]